MIRHLLIGLVAAAWILSSCSNDRGALLEERIGKISKAELIGVTEMLGHDLLEGRAPGTRGGDLAEVYLKSVCQFMDFLPGEGDSYLQPFVMKGFTNAVFVGFGITTDLWDWDDYKDVDVKNKIVITRVNDPGMYDPKIFEGITLTYFGRWTYHIEEAARRGAAGILLIHTEKSAGYDWNVVKNSWTGEELYIDSDLQNNLKFRGRDY